MRAKDIVFRFCRPEDFQAVREFACADRRRRYTREAQEVIREAPDRVGDPELDFHIVLAVDPQDRIVGVIVFGVDPEIGRSTIFSMGSSEIAVGKASVCI